MYYFVFTCLLKYQSEIWKGCELGGTSGRDARECRKGRRDREKEGKVRKRIVINYVNAIVLCTCQMDCIVFRVRTIILPQIMVNGT